MKRRSAYANMTASDLARVTRERGLEKPPVHSLSEWEDWLEAQDAKRRAQAPEFATVDAIDTISVPADTVANLVTLVSALAQRAHIDMDTPTPDGDESLDLVSRLERRLALALPEIPLLSTPANDAGDPSIEGDAGRDEADADPNAVLPMSGDEYIVTNTSSVEALTSIRKRPTPPKAKA
jgi:hypothetical protein